MRAAVLLALMTMTMTASARPATTAVVDRKHRAQIAAALGAPRETGPVATLGKAEMLGPIHHLVVPLLRGCFAHVAGDGVVNLELAVDSLAGEGTIFSVRDFDTAGAVTPALRDCLRGTVEAIVAPPIGNGGHAELIYPFTFAQTPPDNHDTRLVDEANAAAEAGRWDAALAAAERALTMTSLDGPVRRKLIGIAGVAACHLKDEKKARHYALLASDAIEPQIRAACASATPR
jgi:hypothetical protein